MSLPACHVAQHKFCSPLSYTARHETLVAIRCMPYMNSPPDLVFKSPSSERHTQIHSHAHSRTLTHTHAHRRKHTHTSIAFPQVYLRQLHSIYISIHLHENIMSDGQPQRIQQQPQPQGGDGLLGGGLIGGLTNTLDQILTGGPEAQGQGGLLGGVGKTVGAVGGTVGNVASGTLNTVGSTLDTGTRRGQAK